MIGWEGNAPSCLHSSIRGQSPHLCIGDLNLLQLAMRENQQTKNNSKSQTTGLQIHLIVCGICTVYVLHITHY